MLARRQKGPAVIPALLASLPSAGVESEPMLSEQDAHADS